MFVGKAWLTPWGKSFDKTPENERVFLGEFKGRTRISAGGKANEACNEYNRLHPDHPMWISKIDYGDQPICGS